MIIIGIYAVGLQVMVMPNARTQWHCSGDTAPTCPHTTAPTLPHTDAPSTNPTLLVKDSMSTLRGAPSIMLPHQPARLVRHFALDIGGSLIKLIFFAVDADTANTDVGGMCVLVRFSCCPEVSYCNV